jgi:hypothetical protein
MKPADVLVTAIATGSIALYHVTKRFVDPYVSRKPFARWFFFSSSPGASKSSSSSGVAAWRVVNFASYLLNVAAVSVPGRIDDQMAKEMKEAKEKNNSNTNDNNKEDNYSSSGDGINTIRRTSRYRSLFTPAGYAFAIWGFIFASELVFSARAMFFRNTRDETFAANATGFFALANVLQSVWCFTFREWTEKPKRHWINAFVLGTEALALWSSKERVFEVNGRFASESGFVSVPIRTHFAWILCACGINANTVVAKVGSASAQVVAAIGTAVLATAVGAYSSYYRGDAATPLVFAWALYAIYKDGGHRKAPPSNANTSADAKEADKKVDASAAKTKTTEIPSEKQTKQFIDIARACAFANLFFASSAFFVVL